MYLKHNQPLTLIAMEDCFERTAVVLLQKYARRLLLAYFFYLMTNIVVYIFIIKIIKTYL